VPEQEGEVEEDHLPQSKELQEAPLILKIVEEKEVAMRDMEGGMRDQTNQIRNQ